MIDRILLDMDGVLVLREFGQQPVDQVL